THESNGLFSDIKVVLLHLWAFASFGPAVEFKLQLFVRRWVGHVSSRFSDVCSQKYATFPFRMSPEPQAPSQPELLYCPRCAQEVTDPLTCGDCSSVICRRCGTPLESPDELGIG